ncbi:hypothetical protein AArc1_2778 [Natrarchaeobaculum sulfurireducens]|uniref:Uncharacterized protein n=1 Tax=Natrarchaeobaculum sulfurireducens TaxID=2044521 RepID=A0A346PHU5_9EURY|nr:hypothetical protein AArc1_2778 [Natrarchaeobaculum sulfurireducens]
MTSVRQYKSRLEAHLFSRAATVRMVRFEVEITATDPALASLWAAKFATSVRNSFDTE